METFFQELSLKVENPSQAPSGEKNGVSEPLNPPRLGIPSSWSTGRT